MPNRKRSRRGGKSVSTSVNQQNELQGDNADLEQLIMWLEDFDMQFESRYAQLDEFFERKLQEVDDYYTYACLKIPPEILNSKFIMQPSGKENSNSPTATGSGKGADTLHSRHRKRSRSANVTSSVGATDSHLVTRSSSLNSRKRVPKHITSTTTDTFKTPALKSTFAFPPSLITPKVQPNVPLSLVRHPRQGEVAFSATGSPLVVSSTVFEQKANVNLCLADGRVVSILPEPILAREIPEVDEETRQQLLNLRKHMDIFINQTKL